MRVTMLTVGSRGDVQPFLAFGLGLAQAGHEVRLATHPRYEALVSGHGLEFAPLVEGRVSRGAETAEGRQWIERGNRRLPAWVGFLHDARSVAHRRLADAAAACEGAEAIVASNLAMVLGWQMADRQTVPLVRAYIEPPAWMLTKRSTRRAAPAARQLAWLAARPWLNRVRSKALGLPRLPLREPFAVLDRRRMPVLYAFSPAVLPRPAGLGDWADVTGFWFVDDSLAPEPPAGLPEFLAAGAPPVSVGFSSMIDTDRAGTVQLVVEALRRAGRRGVLVGATREAGRGALPPDVFAVDEVSHAWLFPRCATVVHHAAVGTTAAGLLGGAPAVAIPHMTDQFFWARRLHELGVSPPPIPRRRLTVDGLADAIRIAAADDGIRRRAADLSARIRAEDGVARAVEVFEHRVARPFQPDPRSKSCDESFFSALPSR
jgi:sterol 3beta-glucosyltransferase